MLENSGNFKTDVDEPEKITEKLKWWIKVRTSNPNCVYYFGAFESLSEAAQKRFGFIKDLKTEEAEIVSLEIKQYQPQQLTICNSEEIASEIKIANNFI